MTEYLGPIKITKAYKNVSRHGKGQISISPEIYGILPRGRRPHELFFTKYTERGTYGITPLTAHIAAGFVHVPILEVESFVKSLPIVNYKPTPVPASDWPEAEELAKGVTNPTIAILDLKGKVSPPEPYVPEVKPKAENLYWLTITELKQRCRERGLPDSGNKEDLIRRLKK